MKDIILFIEADRSCPAAMGLAAALAHQNDAFLVGMCHIPEPVPSLSACYAIGPGAAHSVVAEMQQSADDAVAATEADFARAVVSSGCWADLRNTEVGEPVERVARLASFFDLAVIPLNSERDLQMFDAVVLKSGTPCLVVPEDAAPSPVLDRVILAWDGSRESKRAMADAMPLLRRAKAVRLLAVGRAVEAVADSGPDGVIEHLARHGVSAELHLVADPVVDVGSTLIDQTTVFGATLVVMGAYGQGRLVETLTCGVSRVFLKRCKVPILMSH
jgi:nucleotide-binding universal stress UspA family protein